MSYEVQCLTDKRWLTEGAFQEEAEALAFARSRLMGARAAAVRVVEEKTGIGGHVRERVIFEQMAAARDKRGASALPVETATLCDTVVDLYALPARQVIARVLRHYLNQEGIAALELLAAPERLKHLVRHDDLLNQSISSVAGVQSRLFGGQPQDRITALFALLGETHAMLAEAGAVIGPIGDDLLAGRVAALKAHLESQTEPARKRVLALCGIGRCLFREAESAGKIGLLLDIATRAGGDAGIASLCDEVIAEILDDQGAMRRMLGKRADLADASRTVLDMIAGRRARIAGDDPILSRLARAVGTGGFPQARSALVAWLDQAVRSTQTLTREGRTADRTAFAALIGGMETQYGLMGGAVMAEAALMRARSVLFGVEEEQRTDVALDRLMRMIGTPGCQLGLLLDLLDAPTGPRMAPTVARQIIAVLREVPDLATLTDLTGKEAEALLAHFRERLAGANLPEQIRDMLTTVLGRLAVSSDPDAAAELAAERAADPHRVELAASEMLFRAGDQADCAFLVLSGRIGLVTVVNGRELPVGALGPGDVVGEAALNGTATRPNNARALLPSVVRRVAQDRFDQALERMGQADPDALVVVNSLRGRLRDLARRGVAV